MIKPRNNRLKPWKHDELCTWKFSSKFRQLQVTGFVFRNVAITWKRAAGWKTKNYPKTNSTSTKKNLHPILSPPFGRSFAFHLIWSYILWQVCCDSFAGLFEKKLFVCCALEEKLYPNANYTAEPLPKQKICTLSCKSSLCMYIVGVARLRTSLHT